MQYKLISATPISDTLISNLKRDLRTGSEDSFNLFAAAVKRNNLKLVGPDIDVFLRQSLGEKRLIAKDYLNYLERMYPKKGLETK